MNEWQIVEFLIKQIIAIGAVVGVLSIPFAKQSKMQDKSEKKFEDSLTKIVEKNDETNRQLSTAIQELTVTVRDLTNYYNNNQRDIQNLKSDLRELDKTTYETFKTVEDKINEIRINCVSKKYIKDRNNE